MDRFRIIGPSRLEGTIRASGAKNAALPALAASLLTDDPLTLDRIPDVVDIRTMLTLLRHLGIRSERKGESVHLTPGGPQEDDAPYELVKKMRASVLVLAPLLARHGHARVSLPGGCAIGVRPIDQHLAVLEAMGASVSLEHGYVEVKAEKLSACNFRFSVPTVTGTENAMMAACLGQGTTRLENCAREPEIIDLAHLLNAMNARIEGAGTEVMTIEGVPSLGGAKHRIIADRIEAGTYLIGAVLTGGSLILQDCEPEHLIPLLEKLGEVGADLTWDERQVCIRGGGTLRPKDILTAPHPGFPTDLQAQFMVLLTQASGQATVCERIFENRFQHVAELSRMGANIQLDGAFAHIQGPTPLSGANVMATDLRASASLVLAGLVAEGETLVHRIYHLDRGYESMETKLASLGAQVERISGPPFP